MTRAELMSNILEGYRRIYPAKEGNKIDTVIELEEMCGTVEIGELRDVYICSSLNTAARDAREAYGTRATLARHLDDLAKRIQHRGRNVVLGKRRLEAYEEDIVCPKKRKAQENQDITYDEGTTLEATTVIFDETTNLK